MSKENKTGLIRPYKSQIAILHRAVDAFLIFLSLVLISKVSHIPWHDRYSFIAIVGVLLFLVFSNHSDLYRTWRFSRLSDELLQFGVTWMAVVAGLVTITFLMKTSTDYSRFVVGAWFLVVPVLLGIYRLGVRTVLHRLRREGMNTRSVAIVGANDLGYRLSSTLQSSPWMGLRFAGYYDDRKLEANRISDNTHNSLYGDIDLLIDQIHKGAVDIVYIAFPLRAEPRVNEVLNRLSDTTASVYYVPDFNVFDILHGRWITIGDMHVVSINETPHLGIDGAIKRIEDLVLSTLILAVLLIPMLLIALGVKLSSRGPVIFKQRRYGMDGQEILVWKFRSMTVCEDGDDIAQAKKCDVRVTPFGAFLRRTSLDELPQFFNVLQGSMSIVGPRPHAVAHNEAYRKLINRYMLRHKVKPGITGLAQVNGWRGETDTLEKMERRVEHDLHYIQNWSLILDLKLIGKTMYSGFRDKNAY